MSNKFANKQYGQQGTGNTKLEEAQRKVDDVKGVMHQNIRQCAERQECEGNNSSA